MEDLLTKFLEKNRRKKLLVYCIGDAMMDEYYEVKVDRISPEFPMPIMHSTTKDPVVRPGGVANVAYQFRHFNADAKLVCLSDGFNTNRFLPYGIDAIPTRTHLCDFVELPIKRRFLDNGIQVTRHDIEKHLCGLCQSELDEIVANLAATILFDKPKPDVVILSDYDKGFFSAATDWLSQFPDSITIVDPKHGPLDKWFGCKIFKPNAKEAAQLSGLKDWEDQAMYFADKLNCESVVITFGGEKVAGIHKGVLFSYKPDRKVQAESVVGAGDCFCAFLGMAVGHGFDVPDAARIAWHAGAVYVQNKMNRPIVPAELAPSHRVHPLDLTKRDFRLVFTNGCFDILHEGHMRTLEFAKSKGDKLVVALNSDASVKRLKGPSRPILPLEQRMAVMSRIGCVDFVVSFDEDTPLQILETIRPDVLVKGADYGEGEIVGEGLVKEVHRAPLVGGLSTSSFVKPPLSIEHFRDWLDKQGALPSHLQ